MFWHIMSNIKENLYQLPQKIKIMKTLKEAFSLIFKNRDNKPKNARTSVNHFKPFHLAPSFWALIPVKIESNKFPQNRPTKQSDLFD